MPKDFGYFGKGAAGYAHYKTAFDRRQGRPNRNRGRGPSGCLGAVLTLAALLILSILVR